MPTLDEYSRIDKERYRIKQLIDSIYHHSLNPYIANVNRREVLDALFAFFTNENVVVISKQQLRVYEEMEKLSINQFKLTPDSVMKKE